MRFGRHVQVLKALFALAACGPQPAGDETGSSASGTGIGGTSSASGTGSNASGTTGETATGSGPGGTTSTSYEPECGVDTIIFGGPDGSECPIPPDAGSWPECPGPGNGGGVLGAAWPLPSDFSLSTTGVVCTVTANDLLDLDPIIYDLSLTCDAPFEEMHFSLQRVPRVPLEVGEEVIVHGRQNGLVNARYMWTTIHRARDLRLVFAALGDEMPCPDVQAAHWQPLEVELLDPICPEVLWQCGSTRDLAFRVTVDGDAVIVGRHSHADVGVSARYAIHVNTAFKRPCYVPCAETHTTEYELVAIYLDPEMPSP